MKSDTELQQEVMAELRWEPTVVAAAIGVEVRDGIVTLAGHVDSFVQRWGAEKAAQRVAGLRALAVEIDVALSSSSKRCDSDIALAARNAIDWDKSLPGNAIRITVRDGVVTLSGMVETEEQRDAALATLRDLGGLAGVASELKVKPRFEAAEVKAKIESALHRQAALDASGIVISVDGCEVTLGGIVRSWAEKTAAREAAWAAPGVWTVVDRITVAAE